MSEEAHQAWEAVILGTRYSQDTDGVRKSLL